MRTGSTPRPHRTLGLILRRTAYGEADLIVEFGDGWVPMGGEPDSLRREVEELQGAMADAGRGPADVVVVTSLPLRDRSLSAARVRELAAAGVTGLIHGWRYRDADEFARVAEARERLRDV